MSERENFLNRIAAERQQTLSLLIGVSEADLLARPVNGEWSAKDFLIHLMAWEDWSVRESIPRLRDGKPVDVLAPEFIQPFNDTTHSRWRDTSLKEALDLLYSTRQVLVEAIMSWPEERLPAPWTRGSGLGLVITHEKQHREHIRTWRETLRSGKENKG